MRVLHYGFFLVLYIGLLYLSYQSQRWVGRGRFALMPLTAVASGVAPAVTLWLLTDRFSVSFLLLSCAYVTIGQLAAWSILRLAPPKYWFYYASARLGIEVGSRQGCAQVLTFGLAGLASMVVVAGYPVLIGYWYFSDGGNTAQLIVSTTFAQTALLYLLTQTISSMLLMRGTAPERVRNLVLTSRFFEIVFIGPLLAFFFISVQQELAPVSTSVRDSVPVALRITGFFLLALLISIVPYVLGWWRGRRVLLRHLRERMATCQRLIGWLERGEDDTSATPVLTGIEAAVERYSGEEFVARAWILAGHLQRDLPAGADMAAVRHEIRDLAQDFYDDEESSAQDQEFWGTVAHDDSVLYAMTAVVMTMLNPAPAFPEDEHRLWFLELRERISALLADIKNRPDGAERRVMARLEAFLLRMQLKELGELHDRIAARKLPGVAVVGTLTLGLLSAGFQEIGIRGWNLIRYYLEI